jgi:hypothetical protein
MTGQGGWPLNVFLTPEQEPFFAGTYFPPLQRPGLPSWRMVIDAIHEAWTERPQQVREQGARLAAAIAAGGSLQGPGAAAGQAAVSQTAVADAVHALGQMFDRTHGGWGGAPKFPPHCVLEFLFAAGDVELAPATLHAMADGGIYDQVGGGFHRYAVDATWTVPHFEKMLYDNALLARAYLHGWQVTREPRFRDICRETLDWALREMRGPEGGFCSALDADSEGVEGRFYVWDAGEIAEALGPGLTGPAIDHFLGIPAGEPNFEGHAWVLESHGAAPDELPEIRRRLLAARERRVRPGLDDKRLTAWNALMIAALAAAGAALACPAYLDAAVRCAEFLLSELRDGEGNLLRTWKDGHSSLPAYLEDHAYLLQALLALYEASFDERWYVEAVATADAMIARFGDREHGGFFTTAGDAPFLVSRRKDLEDNPIPSGNSAAALGLLRLARLSGESSYEQWAAGVLALHSELALRHPLAFGHLLQALDLHLATPREVAVVGAGPLAGALRSMYLPHAVLAGTDASSTEGTAVALLRGRELVDGRQAAYVCERFACRLPVTNLTELQALL